MYQYFKGIITQIEPAYLVIEAGGIGYLLYVANPYRFMDSLNKEVVLYVYQHIGQDSQLLYGFKDYKEKELFLRLIKVSGIGPKSALAILANENHAGLIRAIESKDEKYLMQFPGVGKKTAGQLILDLKGKLGDLVSDDMEDLPDLPLSSENPALEEALQALEALGYSKRECTKVQKTLEKEEETSTDEYLRQALSLLTSF